MVVTFDGGFVDVRFAAEQAPRFSENFFPRDGRISNWDHFETLMTRIFKKLGALFKAELIGGEGGVHPAACSSIMKCDVGLRADLFGHGVLGGRLMAIPGVSEPLTKELSALAPPSMHVRNAASSERAHVVWIGASLLVNLSTFKQMWVSRKDYDTSGPSIIGKKAF